MGYYLAIDIDETVGRHILGYLEKDKLQLEEIYRFENVIVDHEGEKCWDLLHMFYEIKKGMTKCRDIGKLPIFIGIDTTGADIALLDNEDKVIGNAVAYSQRHNTIHQLKTMKEKYPDYSEKTKTLLTFPDYLNFLLTGVKLCEYTTVMTTQLANPVTQQWDEELIEGLGYSLDIFPKIRRPGAVLGNLTREVTEEVGYDCIIVLPATHATSSAIFALPKKECMDLLNDSRSGPVLQTVGSEAEYPAAAVGNLLVQFIISHELQDVQAAQECVKNSFLISD